MIISRSQKYAVVFCVLNICMPWMASSKDMIETTQHVPHVFANLRKKVVSNEILPQCMPKGEVTCSQIEAAATKYRNSAKLLNEAIDVLIPRYVNIERN